MRDRWPQFSQRMRVTSFYMDPHFSGDAIGTLWQNTLTSLSLFFAENAAVYYLPGDAVVDLLSAVALIAGVVYCLRYATSRAYLLLPVWFALGLLPSILSHAVRLPHALRAAALLPLVPILAATGLVWVVRSAPIRQVARTAAVAGVLATVAVMNLGTYFVSYAGSPAIYGAFDPVPSEAARAVIDLSERYDVFVSPLIAEHSSFRVLTYGKAAYRRLETANLVGVAGAGGRDVACVIAPFDVTRYQDQLTRLRRDLPGGETTEVRSPHGQLLFNVYRVRRSELPSSGGTSAQGDWEAPAANAPILHTLPDLGSGLLGWYYQDPPEGPMWLGAPKMVRVDLSPGPGAWAAANFPFSVIWRGSFRVASSGDYRFGVTALGKAWVLIDGVSVAVSSRADSQALPLTAGDHAIEVRYVFTTGKPAVQVSWTRPDGISEPLPSGILTPATAMDAPSSAWRDMP